MLLFTGWKITRLGLVGVTKIYSEIMLNLLKKNIYILFVVLALLLVLNANAQSVEVYDLKTPLVVANVHIKDPQSIDNRLIYTLSTLSQDNITLSWQNSYTKKTKTKWFVRLQYRLSEDEQWQDVKDKNGRTVEMVTMQKRIPRKFDNIVLPQECNNKDFVQISWLMDTYSKNKGGYPDIVFKNIRIKSDFDKFFGQTAVIKVHNNNDDTKEDLTQINFNKIPLPYVFPETKRIVVLSQNIRDSITIRISGSDAAYFSSSITSIEGKYPSKTLTISYAPKKEGHHQATLVIDAKKLPRPIEIKLNGICATHTSYDADLLPDADIQTNKFSYTIPVFSNTDYQYRINQKTNKYQPINIKYKWYRDSDPMFVMYDTVKKLEYCAALKSPNGATTLEIELFAKDKIDIEDYFGSPKTKMMIKSGQWSDVRNWKDRELPNVEDFVVIDKGVNAKVDKDVSCNTLILLDSAHVSINKSKTFYISNNIFYNKNAYFTVSQQLLSSRWNYICSPINQAHAAIFSLLNSKRDNETWLMQYNTGHKSKLDDYWSEYITDPQFKLLPAKGYAVYTHQDMEVKYEGLLCPSSVGVQLVSTPEDRWNLVGNPYTAPLSSKKLFEDIDGRIQGNAIMLFDRNTKVYNPIIIDAKEEVMIPSLESFFVEALKTSSEITFKRTHQYIPKTSDQSWLNNNYLNLSVSKGYDWQYVLLGMNNESEYGFDDLDCHKLFGNSESMPDVYLKDANDEYSVCVVPSYPVIYDVGLYIGEDNNVELSLNNLSILPDYVYIFMENKTDGTFIDFCKQDKINIDLHSGTTDDYRIHILKSLDIEQSKYDRSGVYLWSDKGRMLFFNEGLNNIEKIQLLQGNKTIFVENVYGGKVFSYKLNKGKYVVKLLINGKWSENINLSI